MMKPLRKRGLECRVVLNEALRTANRAGLFYSKDELTAAKWTRAVNLRGRLGGGAASD